MLKEAVLQIGPPRMSDREQTLFEGLLTSAKYYMEFGCGGSTLLATRSGTHRIVSVESDAKWIRRIRLNPLLQEAEAQGRLKLLHIDIGPTKAWGFPIDESRRDSWPSYSTAPWECWIGWDQTPDLILIDGRFRVACCLEAAARMLKAGTRDFPKILLHDVSPKRPHYGICFRFLECIVQVETLAVLVPRANISLEALQAELARSRFDPR